MSRDGFTLIEVLMAMVILGFSLLGVQAVITDRLLTNVSREDARATAQQLVEDRLQVIQAEPQYSAIVARYAGAEDSVPRYPNYQRATFVADRGDHTVATVRVITPLWGDTLTRSLVIGAP